MPIRDVTPKGEVGRFMNGIPERARRVLVRRLAYAGERAVNAARESGSYKDRTGNLRSSTGYVIAEDGNIIAESGFGPVKRGEEGARKGRGLAERLARGHGKGLVLIVVAGESYAKYVAARGYDVLDSAVLLAERLVPQMLRQLGMI